MPGPYWVRSGATGANDGSDWANAYTTLAQADTNAVSGDLVYVADDHSEDLAVNPAYNWGASPTNPIKVLSCDKTNSTPTLKAGARIGTQTGVQLTINNTGSTYYHGITFHAGGAGSSASSNIVVNNSSGNRVILDACRLELCDNATNTIDVRHAEYINPTFWFRNANQSFVQASAALTRIRGGSISTAVNSFVSGSPNGAQIAALFTSMSPWVVVEGFDCYAMAAGFHLSTVTGSNILGIFRGIRLPDSWSGSVNSAGGGVRAYSLLANSGPGDLQYGMELKTYFGSVKHDTATYRSGGPTPNGVSGLSWKMVGSGNTFPLGTLDSPEMSVHNVSVGSAKTITVHILRDSVTNLTDKDIWIEVLHKKDSGSTLLTLDVDDKAASLLASAADQDSDSAASWTHGMTNPNKQKLVATITPAEEGPIYVVVRLAAATTVYVCPKVEIT